MKNLKLFYEREIYLNATGIKDINVNEWPWSLFLCNEKEAFVLAEEKLYRSRFDDVPGCLLSCESVGHPVACVIFDKAILLWRYTDDQVFDTFTPTGSINAVAFSPDKSVFSFVCDNREVHLMSSSLELICSSQLDQQGFGKAAPVALGWGKKETQFHGSLGKQAALKSSEPLAPSDKSFDDKSCKIAWRDDGQYFCVSWPNPAFDGQRCLRIFTDSGELFSTSQPVSGMESALCWRPRIQLLTGIQRRPQRGLYGIFFETNAERHGELLLLDADLEPHYRVDRLQFEDGGNILAVLSLTLDSEQSALCPAFIRLFMCSNYHWSVKRELRLFTNDPYPPVFSWAPGCSADERGDLYVSYPFGVPPTLTQIHHWSFVRAIHHNVCMVPSTFPVPRPVSSPGFTAVIDGNAVKLTAMARSVIPPPMFASELKITYEGKPCPVASVSFPGPWIIDESSSTVPILVQLESRRGYNMTHALIVHLNCGSTSQSCFTFGELRLQATWLTGSRQNVPWPQSIRAVDLSPLNMKYPLANHVGPENELKHVCWLDASQFLFVAQKGLSLGYLKLGAADTDDKDFEYAWLLTLESPDPHGHKPRICGIQVAPGKLICIQLTDGSLLLYDVESLQSTSHLESIETIKLKVSGSFTALNSSHEGIRYVGKLPAPCEQVSVVSFTSGELERHKKDILQSSPMCRSYSFILALHASSHRLYAVPIPNRTDFSGYEHASVQPTAISDFCSSFLVLPNFLLITSMKKLLICVPTRLSLTAFADESTCLKEIVSHLNIPSVLDTRSSNAAPVQWYSDFLHPIEQGAILVQASPTDSKVVIQLPRGNLEEVHPRALVLSRIADYLNSLNFLEALILMRKHRVNLNLMYDHNPPIFLQNLPLILNQCSDPEVLTLFVSELIEEDVTKTIYGKFYGSPTAQLEYKRISAFQTTSACQVSKVNSVCDAMLDSMLKDKRYLLPVLTCYAKKQPVELDKALLLLGKYRADGDEASWERGVRHVQYFVTPAELYKIALGTYDLDLAQLMAERTQLDPKEYLVNLNQLRDLLHSDSTTESMDQRKAYQRFKIDDELTRYCSALRNLRSAGAEHLEQFVSYAKSHALFAEAVKLCEVGSSEFQNITQLWAEHLVANRKLPFAGEVYLRGGHYAEASRAFFSAGLFTQWAIAISQWSNIPGGNDESVQKEIREQANKLAVRLRELRRFGNAVEIYSNYLKDPKMAVLTALDGGLWMEARRLAYYHNIPEVFLKHLDSKLTASLSSWTALLHKTETQFNEHMDRLIALREEHKTQAECHRAAQIMGQGDIGDTLSESEAMSDASSVSGSAFSDSGTAFTSSSLGSRQTGRSTKSRRKRQAAKWSSKKGSKYEEVSLLKALSDTIETTQRFVCDMSALSAELWHAGRDKDAESLVAQMNALLLRQKSMIPVIWDEWLTEKENEIVSDNRFDGRKRYPFKERFLLFAPTMDVTKLDCLPGFNQ